jgi:hypothetical protein
VRLIGFRVLEDCLHHDSSTLNQLWLDADVFYGILQQWMDDFNAGWMKAPKVSEI